MPDKWDRGLPGPEAQQTSTSNGERMKRTLSCLAGLLPALYVRETVAIANGMTHEGRLFGVPAWLRVDGDDQVTGTPKVPALHLWCLLIDLSLEVASCFMREDQVLASPITIGRPLA